MSDEALTLWKLTRGDTLALLDSLSDEQLLFTPEGPKWQPLYYQFACMARSQLVNSKVVEAGVMDFQFFTDPSLPDKHATKTKQGLRELLVASNSAWLEALQNGKPVKWGDDTVSVDGQAYRMIAHERLHHGQLISYFTLAGFDFPEGFKMNWAL